MQIEWVVMIDLDTIKYQRDISSCNNTLAAFEYSRGLVPIAIHEISICSAVKLWVPILCKP